MKRFVDLIEECRAHVGEVFPWDVEEVLEQAPDTLLIDVREPYEYEAMHVESSLNVPRGILETACEYDYEETVPELAAGRDRNIIVICRSGNRSLLAARVMQRMGFKRVCSLKTGLRGWHESDLPLVDKDGAEVSGDAGDEFFATRLRPEQLNPARGRGEGCGIER